MEIHTLLTQFGLTEKESTVYLACLELGMAPVSIIARRARLKRPTVHEVLKQLSQRGIAEFFVRGSTRYYSVQSPREFLESKQQLLGKLNAALPSLLALQNKMTHKPKIMFFEGREEMRKLYLDVLEAKGEILNYFLPEKCYACLGKDWLFENYLHERIRRKIPIRVIMPNSAEAMSLQKSAVEHLRQVRILPESSLHFNNEIYIYNNKINTFSFDEELALQIESQDMTETQRVIFELAWRGASSLN